MLTNEQMLEKQVEKAKEILKQRDSEHLDLLIKNSDFEKRIRDLQTRCFKSRQLTREEYQEVMHYCRLQDSDNAVRTGCWYHYDIFSELSNHVHVVWQAVRDIRDGIERYKPVTEDYDAVLMEYLLGEYESKEMARLERHVGYYMNSLSNGYDAYTASEAAMDAIRHDG